MCLVSVKVCNNQVCKMFIARFVGLKFLKTVYKDNFQF